MTRATGQAWADKCKRLLVGLSYNDALGVPEAHAPFVHPDQLSWTMRFVPLVDGNPVVDGGNAINVQAHTLRFQFREWLPHDLWAG